MTTFKTRQPYINALERAALLREQIAEAQRQRTRAMRQPDFFGEKSDGRVQTFGSKQDRIPGEAQGSGQSSIAGVGHDSLHPPIPYAEGMSLGEQMKLKQADMERARVDEIARGKMMGVAHESMHAPSGYAGSISPAEQLKLKQAKMEAARDDEINRRKLMGAGRESAHAPNPYAAAAPLGVERGYASNPYAVSASLAEQMKRQKDEMERKRSAEMNLRKPMDAGHAAGVSLADQMRKEVEVERARNEAFYRRKTMGAGHEAAHIANANAASMSLTDGSAAPFGKVDKEAQKLKPAQPNTQLEANKKKKAAKETGHAMFEPPENKPPPAAAPIISQPRTRRFPDLEEEAVGQSPNPTITAAMKRPQGRVRMEYAAEKTPGAQGYFIIGEPNGGLMVSGARRVGPDRWYVPPGTVFSVEGPQGKAGVGGYRIKEATFRK